MNHMKRGGAVIGRGGASEPPQIDIPALRALLAREGIQRKALAERAGMNCVYLWQVLQGGRAGGEIFRYRVIAALREMGLQCPTLPPAREPQTEQQSA